MTAKQPQAGEWWQYTDVRIYVVGVKRNGHVVCEYRDGSIATLVFMDWWQHLQDCDSFDWQPEVFTQEELTASYQAIPAADLPPVESPYEYRILREDEQTVATDERMYPDGYRSWTAMTAMDGYESGITVKALRAKFIGWHNVVVRRKVVPADVPTNQQLFEMIVNLRDQMAAMTKPIEVKSQPKRVWVRLYWYDGNIVGRYDHSQPTDPSFREIRHDGYKFYVEVQR